MSEYQYYEFAALDGPISDTGMEYASGCSSRAEVTRHRWRNVYNFGDFHGSAEKLLKYYDAHFYIANWGTARFGLAFPNGCLDREMIRPYLRGDGPRERTLSVKSVGDRTIVWWERNEEEGWGWTEGEGWLDRLAGIREDLMRGDMRALFLGWLADFCPDDWESPRDKGVSMPPLPPGLGRLGPALDALVQQFDIDPDAVAAACELSEHLPSKRLPIASVLDGLPVSEMKALLARVADGEGARVMSELNRATTAKLEAPAGEGAHCVDFASSVLGVRKRRLEERDKKEAGERKQRAAARRRRLKSVMAQAEGIWAGLEPLMDRKIASAYDEAAAQLTELRDAYEQANSDAGFQNRLAAFRDRYAHRPAMMRRIADL